MKALDDARLLMDAVEDHSAVGTEVAGEDQMFSNAYKYVRHVCTEEHGMDIIDRNLMNEALHNGDETMVASLLESYEIDPWEMVICIRQSTPNL